MSLRLRVRMTNPCSRVSITRYVISRPSDSKFKWQTHVLKFVFFATWPHVLPTPCSNGKSWKECQKYIMFSDQDVIRFIDAPVNQYPQTPPPARVGDLTLTEVKCKKTPHPLGHIFSQYASNSVISLRIWGPWQKFLASKPFQKTTILSEFYL